MYSTYKSVSYKILQIKTVKYNYYTKSVCSRNKQILLVNQLFLKPNSGLLAVFAVFITVITITKNPFSSQLCQLHIFNVHYMCMPLFTFCASVWTMGVYTI